MISKIKEALAVKIIQLYPQSNVYDEYIHQNLKKGSFFIEVIEQDYMKTLHSASESNVMIDLLYFPLSKKESLRSEIEAVKQNLFRHLHVVGEFRVIGKSGTLVDDVLHIQLSFKYKECKVQDYTKMNKMNKNTGIKED